MYFDYCKKVFHSLSELKYTGEKNERQSEFSLEIKKILEMRCVNTVTLVRCLT